MQTFDLVLIKIVLQKFTNHSKKISVIYLSDYNSSSFALSYLQNFTKYALDMEPCCFDWISSYSNPIRWYTHKLWVVVSVDILIKTRGFFSFCSDTEKERKRDKEGIRREWSLPPIPLSPFKIQPTIGL